MGYVTSRVFHRKEGGEREAPVGTLLLGGTQALEQSALCFPGEKLLAEAGRSLWVWREKQIEPETLPCAWDGHLARERGASSLSSVFLSPGAHVYLLSSPPQFLLSSSLCFPISPCSFPR